MPQAAGSKPIVNRDAERFSRPHQISTLLGPRPKCGKGPDRLAIDHSLFDLSRNRRHCC